MVRLDSDEGVIKNYLLAIPLLGIDSSHVVDLGQPSMIVFLHLREYSLCRMFQIQDLLQLLFLISTEIKC